MEVIDAEKYENIKNDIGGGHGYGSAIFQYAERWANMMEKEIQKGANVKDIAQRSSDDAHTPDISGYMQEESTNILCEHWKYGNDLKEWQSKR